MPGARLRTTGELAKTEPSKPGRWQRELRHWLRRRSQIVVTPQTQKQQTALAFPVAKHLMAGTIAALQHELAPIDRAIQTLLKTHPIPALRSSKGMGLIPGHEFGIVARTGHLAPEPDRQAGERGTHESRQWTEFGHAPTRGGRAPVRVALHMATLSTVRWDPRMRTHYQQLRARGKLGKVALVACARKLLMLVNARRRDELRNEGADATPAHLPKSSVPNGSVSEFVSDRHNV